MVISSGKRALPQSKLGVAWRLVARQRNKIQRPPRDFRSRVIMCIAFRKSGLLELNETDIVPPGMPAERWLDGEAQLYWYRG